jgi:hypothetical protein
MDLKLIRTLAFYQTKGLVIADSQTYRARYLGMSETFLLQSWPKGIDQSTVYSKCLKMEDTARLRVQYLLAIAYNIHVIVHKQLHVNLHTCIYQIIRGRFRYRRNFIRRRIWRKTWMHANKALFLF